MARDRNYKPSTPTKKYQVPQAEVDTIRADSRHAKELLANPYLINYFTKAKQEILDIHAKQSLCDSTEETEKNGVKRTLKYSAQKEYTILAGQYRFIETLTADLNQAIDIAKALEEKMQNEEIEVSDE